MSAVLETAAPAAARRVTHAALIACERAALEHGLAAGLAAALDTAASSAALPDGGALAPAGRIAALPADRVPAGAELIAHRLGALEGIAFVRSEPTRAEQAEQLTVFGALLGAARLGVSRRLLEWAVEHLSGRTVDGEPTIRKQLVLGSLADVLTRVEAARRLLLVAGSVPAAVTEVHTWITELDWESAKLLGASGFITDSPSRGGYVSRVVANCWIAHQDGAL